MKQFALRRLDVSPAVLSLRLLLESERHYRRRGCEICFNVHVIKRTTKAGFSHCLCVSINRLGEIPDWKASSWQCSIFLHLEEPNKNLLPLRFGPGPVGFVSCFELIY